VCVCVCVCVCVHARAHSLLGIKSQSSTLETTLITYPEFKVVNALF